MNREANIFEEIKELLLNPRSTFAQVAQLKQLREELSNAFGQAGRHPSATNIQVLVGIYARIEKVEREIIKPGT